MLMSISELANIKTSGNSWREAGLNYIIAVLYENELWTFFWKDVHSVDSAELPDYFSQMYEDIIEFLDAGKEVTMCYTSLLSMKGTLAENIEHKTFRANSIVAAAFLSKRYKEEIANGSIGCIAKDIEKIPWGDTIEVSELLDFVLKGNNNSILLFLTEIHDKNICRLFSCVDTSVIGIFMTHYVLDMKQIYDKTIHALERELRKTTARAEKMKTISNTAAKTVTQVVKVRDETVEKSLYDELMLVQAQKSVLEHRLAVYQEMEDESDYKVMEEVLEEKEEKADIDLERYKLLIIGKAENRTAYPFEWVDIDGNTKAVAKIAYVDYVLFDTRCNSHHSYWKVKEECKRRNVPLLHINNRNKDAIYREVKRLIGRKEGIL